MEELAGRYMIFVCPECDDHFRYAGFCDACNKRLMAFFTVTSERIIAIRDETTEGMDANSAALIGEFVEQLLSPPGSQPVQFG